MDPTTFDALTRAFYTAGSRRWLLRLGCAFLPAGLLTERLEETSEAGRAHRRRVRNRRQSGNNKANRTGQRKNQDQPRTQDCPDKPITCYLKDPETGGCFQLVHSFGPVGHCGNFFCCPCDSSDQAYWNNRCNQEVPACNGNKCLAQDEPANFGCFGCPL
jgi:hypothetical protein